MVSVGLVTHDSAADLQACLSSLTAQTHTPLDIVIVDNASADQSVALAAAACPAARIIRNPLNAGFAAAHNQAIRATDGRYYFAVNPDVELSGEYVATLVAALEARPKFGSAAGRLLQPRGEGGGTTSRLDSAGLSMGVNRRAVLRGHGDADAGAFVRSEEVFGVDAAATLYRRAMLDDVREDGQVFDETFFAYKEDVDLAWRARHLGWKAWYEAPARAVHGRAFRPGTRGPGSRRLRWYSVRNRYLTLAKNETADGWRRDWWRILAYDLQILAYLMVREPASLSALPAAARLWPAMRRKHRALMRRARVGPEERRRWFTT